MFSVYFSLSACVVFLVVILRMMFEYVSYVMIANVKRLRGHHNNGGDNDDDADDVAAYDYADN